MTGQAEGIADPYSCEVDVRYAETDAMGVVHHANYFVYFEVARTEALARLGHPYAGMESRGVLIPVLEGNCRYRKPARYGDRLTLRSSWYRIGRARVRFDYHVWRSGELLAEGYTVHAFMNANGRPLRPPSDLWCLFPDQPVVDSDGDQEARQRNP